MSSQGISGHVGDLLVFALLCGAVGYAVVELGKRLFPFRRLYQFRETLQWLDARSPAMEDETRSRDELRQALRMAGGATFSAPAEVLVAQVAAIADGRRPVDLSTNPLIRGLAGFSFPHNDDEQIPEIDEIEEVDGVVQRRIRSGLDQLQIHLTTGWRRGVQTASVVASSLAGVIFASGMNVSGAEILRLAAIASLLGGPIAWTIRDAVAVLEKLRR